MIFFPVNFWLLYEVLLCGKSNLLGEHGERNSQRKTLLYSWNFLYSFSISVLLITSIVIKEKKNDSYIIEAFCAFNSVNNPKLQPPLLGERGGRAAIPSAWCFHHRPGQQHQPSCFAQKSILTEGSEQYSHIIFILLSHILFSILTADKLGKHSKHICEADMVTRQQL